jgi:hypothetical protein
VDELVELALAIVQMDKVAKTDMVNCCCYYCYYYLDFLVKAQNHLLSGNCHQPSRLATRPGIFWNS